MSKLGSLARSQPQKNLHNDMLGQKPQGARNCETVSVNKGNVFTAVLNNCIRPFP